MATLTKFTQGGEYLIKDVHASDIFIPDNSLKSSGCWLRACQDLYRYGDHSQISSRLTAWSIQELSHPSSRRLGELGLFGESPSWEQYEEWAWAFNTVNCWSLILLEAAGSFSDYLWCHTGNRTLPIFCIMGWSSKNRKIFQKTSDQCEWAAFIDWLQPDAESDANSGKDQSNFVSRWQDLYANVRRCGCSNAGFGRFIHRFAKIEDDKNLTAFIVEKNLRGITHENEEKKKMDQRIIYRQVFFNIVQSPSWE